MVLLVVPLVFRAPEGPAAREAKRPHFALRRASKPARALQALRRPSHQWGLVADRCVISKPGQALPPPTGTAAWLLLEPRLSQPTLTSPIPEPHPISHAIPPLPSQTTNSQRWNYNVFRLY